MAIKTQAILDTRDEESFTQWVSMRPSSTFFNFFERGRDRSGKKRGSKKKEQNRQNRREEGKKEKKERNIKQTRKTKQNANH